MQVTKEVVSLSEMARMLGFSRARFYQLMSEGVLPKPRKTAEGGRPFFNREQQEKCIKVRQTNCGIDGRPILFYAMRTPSSSPLTTPTRQARQRPSTRRPRLSGDGSTITALRHGLSQLGVSQITEQKVRETLAETYPDGWSNVDHSELLRAVFGHLNRQDSHDNVSR